MNPEEKPLWNFIPLKDYSRPAAPTVESVRRGISYLWTRLRDMRASEKSEDDQIELLPISETVLDQIAPVPRWHEAITALSEALETWLESDNPDNSVQILVGAPGSGMNEITKLWARHRDWSVIEAPKPEEILSGGGEWIDSIREAPETPLVFPRLESIFLRHYDGLTLLEQLLDWLWSSRQRCLIGCDSWSWAYLSKALQIDSAFPNPLTLEAFDHERLKFWFGHLSLGFGPKLSFLQADSGRPVIPTEELSDEPTETTDFLSHVAAHSRGIPGVASAIWRHSLRTSPDEGTEHEGDAYTFWVPPWSQVHLPHIQGQVSQSDLFVLQELLLDGDMSAQLLSDLLSISFAETSHSLQKLQSAGLLEAKNGVWQVTLLGYTSARQHLNNAGYLVDSF